MAMALVAREDSPVAAILICRAHLVPAMAAAAEVKAGAHLTAEQAVHICNQDRHPVAVVEEAVAAEVVVGTHPRHILQVS
jgi:hypothetical protein